MINISRKLLTLSANHANYANSMALTMDIVKGKAEVVKLEEDELNGLISFIHSTSGNLVGESFVVCDNSKANEI
jgi:hypothetical protein